MSKNKTTSGRFSVTYSFDASSLSEAQKKAFGICVEQTIEFPYGLVKDNYIKKYITGRILSIKKVKNRYLAELSYPESTTSYELTQFLNVMFGNTSIQKGVRVESFSLSGGLKKAFPGPRFGVAGVRKLTGVYGRPFVCSAIKPMGLSPKALAALAYKFAMGGVDFIKDDHGLSNQPFSPFKERVLRVSEAVRKANKETGLQCLYAPNVTAGSSSTMERALFAKRAGAGALVISPGLCGFASTLEISKNVKINLPILSHPAMLGSFTSCSGSGISHYALYGLITRLCGADAAIFPNYGGRFSFSKDECRSIISGCSCNFGGLKSVFMAPGGGMTIDKMAETRMFYGDDSIFLMGGGLFSSGPDLVENCKKFKRIVSGLL
ncbi:MAG: RuBisCO large subunit C-terminal-like domain-containing protein [Spirochaetia bacterium]|nr:RuBisCO large subunit C-terminal-like domain-containing protein [Spirochaetia bacterium]